ncbi:hypothetical protein COUCH_05370 [Couchioplanes caeruleus]|uniref:hypothetical protein n=1 Tax=Couchioplanes caeruleus TaxID=56438 RepID=UPI0020BFCF18|nr:hypothetical protein [Couchioplanes caeruleus]UQU65749.1 hypothetical protein COUCH_05370 [Couchioplanes caeruleus]
MVDPASFVDGENWTGGFYELCLELGPRDDQRLQAALTALWQAAGIDGCCADSGREPEDQPAVPCTVGSLESLGHLRGRVALPTGRRVVCGCFAVRDDGDGPEWIELYLPLGALARTDRRIGGYPFDSRSGPESLDWRSGLDDWLVAIAGQVHRQVPVRLGLVGFEVDSVSAETLGGVVPQERWAGFLLPAGDGLRYEPANR